MSNHWHMRLHTNLFVGIIIQHHFIWRNDSIFSKTHPMDKMIIHLNIMALSELKKLIYLLIF